MKRIKEKLKAKFRKNKIDAVPPHNKPCDQAPITPSLIPLPPELPPSPSDPAPTKTTCKPDQTPGWKMFLDCALFVVGIAAVIVYWRQLNAMNGQLVEMHFSTAATQQAAYAACVSAQIARSALVEEQAGGNDAHNLAVGSIAQANAVTRAEAGQIKITRDGGPAIDHSVGKLLVYPMVVSNIGKSAVINFKVKTEMIFQEYGKEPKFIYTKNASTAATGFISPEDPPEKLFPRVKDAKGGTYILDQEEADRLTNGKDYVMVYGRATYGDIFGVSHWENFCLHIAGKASTANMFPKCTAYNQTDKVPTQLEMPPRPPIPVPDIFCKIPPQ